MPETASSCRFKACLRPSASSPRSADSASASRQACEMRPNSAKYLDRSKTKTNQKQNKTKTNTKTTQKYLDGCEKPSAMGSAKGLGEDLAEGIASEAKGSAEGSAKGSASLSGLEPEMATDCVRG